MTCIYVNSIYMLDSLHVKHVYFMNIHFLHIANIRIHDMYSKLIYIYIM